MQEFKTIYHILKALLLAMETGELDKGGIAYKDDDIKITLKGIEYLEDNSMMKKAANLAKGVIDTVL